MNQKENSGDWISRIQDGGSTDADLQNKKKKKKRKKKKDNGKYSIDSNCNERGRIRVIQNVECRQILNRVNIDLLDDVWWKPLNTIHLCGTARRNGRRSRKKMG